MEDIFVVIKEQISANPILLYMKGSPISRNAVFPRALCKR